MSDDGYGHGVVDPPDAAATERTLYDALDAAARAVARVERGEAGPAGDPAERATVSPYTRVRGALRTLRDR